MSSPNPNHRDAEQQKQQMDQQHQHHDTEGLRHLLYAHYTHTATEVIHVTHLIGHGLHHAHQAIGAFEEVLAAQKMIHAHAQMAYDLARIRRAMVTLGIRAAQGSAEAAESRCV
jgi:hypothetical protein